MKIYTKTGDQGFTSLASGERVPKNHPIIEAVGTLDELNAWIGFLRSHYEDAFLKELQSLLFNLGANISSEKELIPFSPSIIDFLEKKMDELQKKQEPLKNFILPAGGQVSSLIHLIRAVIRRLERQILNLKLSSTEKIFLNRLSDYFFLLARETSLEEDLWKKPFFKDFF